MRTCVPTVFSPSYPDLATLVLVRLTNSLLTVVSEPVPPLINGGATSMSSMFESHVYQRERHTPWAKVSLLRFRERER